MIELLSVKFVFYFLYFVLSVFVAFYFPGVYFVSKLKLSKFQEIVLSFIVGMVLWGWQAYVFGYLGVRWLSYVYLLIFLGYFVKKSFLKFKDYKFKSTVKLKNFDWLLFVLIILGAISQLSSVWFNGILTAKGMYFCCGNIADNLLMISYTNEIVRNFPPLEPGMFPHPIQNYHYWGSLVTGELARVFKLPVIATNFQYMTVFISLFLGLSAIVFSQVVGLGKAFSRWLVFFLYFGGDLIWVLIAIYRRMDFFAMNPLESGQQFLENLPRAFAVVVLFAFFSIFYLFLKRKDKFSAVLMSLVGASVIGFKVYLGIFMASGLFFVSVYSLVKRKLYLIFPLALTFFLSALVYFPVNSDAGGLSYVGFWRFENFILQGFLGDLNRLEYARNVFLEHGNLLRVAQYELMLAAIFIFAIFGTKLLALVQSKKSLSIFTRELNIFLISASVASLIPGSFFIQTTGGSNTFNFLVSVFIMGSIYAALACYYWLKNMKLPLKMFLIFLIVIFTAPRGIYQTYKNLINLQNGAGFLISNNELDALYFISKQSEDSSLVLVDPKIKMDLESPYVNIVSGKKMFLSGQNNELKAHGIDYSQRLKIRNAIFNPEDKFIGNLFRNKKLDFYIFCQTHKF